jgi:hypothetical protein
MGRMKTEMHSLSEVSGYGMTNHIRNEDLGKEEVGITDISTIMKKSMKRNASTLW